MKFRTLLFLGLAGAVIASAADPFLVGVCTHFRRGKDQLAAPLSLIRQAGIRSIRDEFPWRAVESKTGALAIPPDADTLVNEALAHGIEPLLILDYGHPNYDGGDKPRTPEAIEGFVRYAEFVVRHFKGRVKRYEMWNEWDIAIGGTKPGNAEDYFKLIEKVYPRIKKIDPSIEVLGGAPTSGGVKKGWLDKLLELGGLRYMDAVSIHSYNYSAPGRGRTPEAWAEWTAQVESACLKHSGGKPVPLYITEMGWPTHIDARGATPERSAANLARLYLLARTMPYLKGLWWYDFRDDGWKATYNENNFGMVRPDNTPKPSYFAMSAVAPIVAAASSAERIDLGDADMWALRFRLPGGKQALAIWSSHEDDDWQVTLKTGAAKRAPLRMAPAGAAAVERAWGNGGTPDEIALTVRGVPWIVTGDIANVTVTGVARREFPELTRPAPPAPNAASK